MKKYLVEFIGTFLFVLAIVMVVNNGTGAMAPLAIGSALMVMVFAGGHISGAHYNPAVTVAVWLRGKCELADVPFYILAQVVGAVLAALTATFLLGPAITSAIKPMPINVVPTLIAEFIGTFALCYVVLNVATSKSTAGNFYYGLAIGFAVLVMAYALGGISGGAFNPAVAIGVSTSGNLPWSGVWAHIVAELAAGAVAAIIYKFVYEGHKD